METKLLYVETDNSNEKIKLQQEYLEKDGHFIVPTTETETVQTIVRSLCFQYFQNSLPPIAAKIKQFIFKSLNMTLSLTLLRQILILVSQQHENMTKFRQYFVDINHIITQGEHNHEQVLTEDFNGQEESKDYIFQMADRGVMHATRLIEQIDLSEELEKQCQKMFMVKPFTQNTQETYENINNPEEKNQPEKLGHTNNLLGVFYSAQGLDESQWWKKQNHFSDESKEISKFEKKGGKVMHQKSITRLVIDEMKRDLNRQIQLGKDIHKHEEHLFKFSKGIKNKITQAKLRKRRR